MAAALARSEEAAPAPAHDVGEIEVTATRLDMNPLVTPYTTYRLDGAPDGTVPLSRTTPEMLQSVPSALIQKTSHGQGSPFLRGFTGFRTLMLIDGIRLNNSVFRDGPNQYWNTVDPLSLRGLEVVMGPASVLYGSDAIGGTVNALPQQPPPAGGPAFEGRAYYRGSTAEQSSIGRFEAGGRADARTGYLVGFSVKEFGDVEGGADVGRQSHTGYEEWDADLQINRSLGEFSTLTLGHQTVRQNDAWRTHRTPYGLTWHGLKHGTDRVLTYDQARDLTWTTLSSKELGGFIDEVRLTLYRQAQSEDEYRVKEDGGAGLKGFDVTTWGANAQFASETESGRWVYGVELARDLVASYSHKLAADGRVSKKEIQGPVADDATYDTVGVYAQDIIPLLNRRLQVIPGLRYTYSRADADRVADPFGQGVLSVEGDWEAVVGSLRAALTLDDDERLAAFAGVSQGFRSPNFSDLTRLDIARSGELETPVTNLDSERYVSLEAGVKFRGETVSAQMAYYRTLVNDMIVRAPTGRTVNDALEVTKRNSGEGWIEGVELSGDWRLADDWTLRGLAAWMDGDLDSYPTSDPMRVRDTMSRLMPVTAELALRWQPDGFRGWVEAAVRGAADADHLSAEDRRDTQRIPPGGTPGYTIGALRGGVRLWADTHLTLAVENITDRDYRLHGSGMNEPGRNFVLSVDTRF